MRAILLALFLVPVAGLSQATAQTEATPPAAESSLPPPRDCAFGPYIIFFAPGGTHISEPAREILDNAIRSDRECVQTHRFTVVGHADRSGSAAISLALSGRRAAAVADYLAAHGVAREGITIRGVGESRPLVQTRDGVSNAENRYVAVDFQ